MRIVGRVALGLLTLIVVLMGVAYLLPRNVEVTRSTNIDAPPEAVFPYVNSLQETARWSPWLDIDPEVAVTYSGPESGVGNRMEWTSSDPQVGSGSQEIVESEAPSHVRSDLDFGAMGTADAWFDLSPSASGTEVTWGLNADMGNAPLGRWMGLMMDNWVGADYERGLARLKELVEAG